MKRNRICKDCGAQYVGSMTSSYCLDCRMRRYKENGLRTADRMKDSKAVKEAPKLTNKERKVSKVVCCIVGVFIALWSVFGIMCYFNR